MRDIDSSMDRTYVPTRILWGKSDLIIKSGRAIRLDEYFADFQLDTVPGTGHFVH